jgi:hypothetical protein
LVPRGVLGGVIAPSSHYSNLIEIPLGGEASWENDLYCVQTVSETLCSFNQVYSMICLQNHRSIHIKWQQVKTEWGVNGEGAGEIELQINAVRDGALEGFRNGLSWK